MTIGIMPKSSVGFRREESYASGGSVNAYQCCVSADVSLAKTYSMEDRICNTAEQVGARIMQESSSGNISFGVTPGNSQEWWRCGIGQSSTPYYPTRNLESMVIEVDRDINSIYTSGDMISTIEFTSSQGGELMCNVAFEGKGFQTGAALTPTYTSGDTPFLHSEGVFEFNDTADNNITDFNVTLNNNLVTDLYANQKNRLDIPATKAVVTGSFTRLFRDTLEYNTFISEQERKIEATYSRGSNQFKITLARVRLLNETAPLSSQTAHIVESFDFAAYVNDPTSEHSIQIDVT